MAVYALPFSQDFGDPLYWTEYRLLRSTFEWMMAISDAMLGLFVLYYVAEEAPPTAFSKF